MIFYTEELSFIKIHHFIFKLSFIYRKYSTSNKDFCGCISNRHTLLDGKYKGIKFYKDIKTTRVVKNTNLINLNQE